MRLFQNTFCPASQTVRNGGIFGLYYLSYCSVDVVLPFLFQLLRQLLLLLPRALLSSQQLVHARLSIHSVVFVGSSANVTTQRRRGKKKHRFVCSPQHAGPREDSSHPSTPLDSPPTWYVSIICTEVIFYINIEVFIRWHQTVRYLIVFYRKVYPSKVHGQVV